MNAQLKESGTQLLPVETINAVEVFHDRPKLDELLQRIRAETATLVPDITTEAGRKLIASTAYKVARSKTAIDEAGKNLVADLKKRAGVIDAERKHARDTLDALKDEIRKPLDEWEAEEARREAALIEEARLRREAEEAARLAEIEERERKVREAEERIAAAERAEAERVAAEQAERERQEREARIAAEAAERAEREAAERIAAAERAAAEAAERERAAAERAEQERIAAEKAAQEAQERAVREAEERAAREAAAAEAARQAEAARIRAEEERRSANQRHRGAVNRKAAEAFVEGGFTEDQAKLAVTLIATGKVPAVSIAY
jgi:hypothetical protein